MINSFIALDFETPNQRNDCACSVGLVRVEGGEIVAREHRLINPDTYFTSFNTGIHGICEDDIKDSPSFDVVWGELSPLLDGADFIAAHNASFDRSVLYKCCDQFGIERPNQKFVCTVSVAKKCWKLNPARLDNVCDHLGIDLTHHQALSDAFACAQIVLRAIEAGYKV